MTNLVLERDSIRKNVDIHVKVSPIEGIWSGAPRPDFKSQ